MPTLTADPEFLTPAQTFAGRYRVERFLGEGPNAQSYLVTCEGEPLRVPRFALPTEETSSPRRVVLKILGSEAANDARPDAVSRLMEFEHPNLAAVLDSGFDPDTGQAFVVYPWLDGGDWVTAARLAGHQQIPYLLAPICRGLGHLHESGYFHGRLHTRNCRVLNMEDPKSPQILLCDYGLVGVSEGRKFQNDLHNLGWMILRGLVAGVHLPEGNDLGSGELEKILLGFVDPRSSSLAYVVRRCLNLKGEPQFESALEILDEVNRRCGLDLAIQAPELRCSLAFDGPMVGRRHEMEVLKRRLEALTGGSLGILEAPILAVLGEMGVGKTRLLKEFIARVEKKKVWILSGVCRETIGLPYAAMAQVLRSLVDTLNASTGKKHVEPTHAHDLVRKYGGELAKVCPDLVARYGLEPARPLEPEQERMRLIDQLSYFVSDASRHNPILITLEDAHWANDGTLDLMRYLSRIVRGGSVHVVLTARREDLPDSALRKFIDDGGGEGWLQQLSLNPLSQRQMLEITKAAIPLHDSEQHNTLEQVSEAGEGNPHQLQEILRHLAEKQILTQRETEWLVDTEKVSTGTLHGRSANQFLERISDLHPEDLKVLQLLSAYGKPADVQDLARMLGCPRWDLQRRIESLTDRAILTRSSYGRSMCYEIRHAHNRTELYDRLTKSEKQELHAAIVSWIDSTKRNNNLLDKAELVRHLAASARYREAFEHGLPIIETIMEQGETIQARSLATLLENHLEEASTDQKSKLLNVLATAEFYRGEPINAIRIFKQSANLTRTQKLEREHAIALMGLTRACFWSERLEDRNQGSQAARQAYQLLLKLSDTSLICTHLARWAGYYAGVRRLDIAERMLAHAYKIAIRGIREDVGSHIMNNLGIIHAYQNRYNRARECFDEAISLARRTKIIRHLAAALCNKAMINNMSGDYRTAAECFTDPALEGIGCRMPLVDETLRPVRAKNLSARGEMMEALEMLLELHHPVNDPAKNTVFTEVGAHLSSTLLYLGRVDTSAQVLEETQRRRTPFVLGSIESLLDICQARIRSACGEYEEAAGLIVARCESDRKRGFRRDLARNLEELISIRYKQDQLREIGELVDELENLAQDGESIGESIAVKWGRAIVAMHSQNWKEARQLLDGAYDLAERAESWVKMIVVLREQISLGDRCKDIQYRISRQSIANQKIQPVLDSLENENDRKMFLEGEIGSVYSGQTTAACAVRNEQVSERKSEDIRAPVRGVTNVRDPKAGGIIGRGSAIEKLLSRIEVAVRGDVGVLILGESGSGKELVAREIHRRSRRISQAFLAVDCGAIPENLIESELFGYKRGAFTGADRDKAGIFEDVGEGTLLLDEIGNAGANFQAKLLRALQEREVRRIGENRSRPIKARVIAATNLNLKAEVEEGRFREDLYYRLSVISIPVPPLRDRKEDIPLLASAFLDEMRTIGQKVAGVAPETVRVLMAYHWPGNVRELKNVLQASTLAADGGTIEPFHLPEDVSSGGREGVSSDARGLNRETPVKNDECLAIKAALLESRGDKSAACRILGWNRMKLYRRMRKYQIPLDFGR